MLGSIYIHTHILDTDNIYNIFKYYRSNSNSASDVRAVETVSVFPNAIYAIKVLQATVSGTDVYKVPDKACNMCSYN